jgi:hypothetical protein
MLHSIDLPMAPPLDRWLSRPTDGEFSCEHPPMEWNEERMLDGKREAAGYDTRVIGSCNEVLGSVHRRCQYPGRRLSCAIATITIGGPGR